MPVKIEVVDWDNYWTLLSAGAQGGEMPDVFWCHSNTVQMYMENDLLLKLNDYVANNNIDMSQYYEGIVQLYTRSDGNIYALPKDHDTIALRVGYENALTFSKIFKSYYGLSPAHYRQQKRRTEEEPG